MKETEANGGNIKARAYVHRRAARVRGIILRPVCLLCTELTVMKLNRGG